MGAFLFILTIVCRSFIGKFTVVYNLSLNHNLVLLTFVLYFCILNFIIVFSIKFYFEECKLYFFQTMQCWGCLTRKQSFRYLFYYLIIKVENRVYFVRALWLGWPELSCTARGWPGLLVTLSRIFGHTHPCLIKAIFFVLL